MDNFKWPKELVEELIKNFRRHENLYNIKHKDYLNRIKRMDSLKNICDTLRTTMNSAATIDAIKRKIHTLRTQYVKELRLTKAASDAGIDTYESTLWCFPQLDFLRPHCMGKKCTGERKPSSNVRKYIITRDKFKWPRDLIMELIRNFRRHENLYNIKHKDYVKPVKRANSLKNICDKLRRTDSRITVDLTKRKLTTLRTQYVKELRLKYAKESGTDIDVYEPKLWCFRLLDFLRPYTMGKTFCVPSDATSDNSNDDPISIIESQHMNESPIAEVEEVECDNISTFQATDRLDTNDLHSMAETALKLVQQSAKRKKETASEKKRNAFAEYIAQELSKIEDEEIAEDTQFSMILLMRDALKKDRQQRKSL